MAIAPADVVIIGGGIVGCATAYELARRGLRPVIIERDSIGSHASGFAFGELLPWWGRGIPGPLFDFGRRCLKLHDELHPTLNASTGINTGYRLTDAVSVALSDADRSNLQQRHDWLREQGAPVKWLDGPALRSIEPRIAPDIGHALYIGSVGVLEAYRYLLAMAQAAEGVGATVRHGNAVGVRVAGNEADAVLLEGESVPCGAVVIAAGPWSGDAADWLGANVPIRPLKGQIVRLQMSGPALSTYIGWRDYYAITKGDGLLWAGSTEEDVGFDEILTTAGRDDILIKLSRVIPDLADAGIEGQTACLRPLTSDGLPIIGRAPNLANVYLATGTGRSGLLLAPGIGSAIADLIVDDATDWDIAPFSPGRFAGTDG